MPKDIPEELQFDILRRLPIAPCIVRFRCACKSWYALISDPSFIRQKLFLPEEADGISDSPPLAMFINNNSIPEIVATRSVYSLHSAKTLEPILVEAELPFDLDKYRIAGCCNGLLCISEGYRRNIVKHGLANPELILWNPATAETKVLPRTSLGCACSHAWVHSVGFGFDAETNDYKVVRQINYHEVGCSRKKEYVLPLRSEAEYLVELYSLRNDSWRRIRGGRTFLDHCFLPVLPSLQVPQDNGNGRLYWWSDELNTETTRFVSFDLSREVFQTADVTKPAEHWAVRSLFMSPNQKEDSLVAICSPGYLVSLEIWAFMKLWVPESWTKLLVIPYDCCLCMGISRNLLIYYIYRDYNLSDDRLFAYHLGTGKMINPNILMTTFQVMNYVASRVSLNPR